MIPKLKILIADDHPIFRDGLKSHLEKDNRLEIVGEAASGSEAFEKLEQTLPDIIILDIDMPGGNGFEVAQKIHASNLPTKIIFLTMHKDERFLNKALDMNIKGYLLKESAVTDIINCIVDVAQGEVFISPSISGYLLKRLRQAEGKAELPNLPEPLTPTELRVLTLIADYKTSRDIADELFVSFRTIETHRANIVRKLGLKGKHALIRYALENKLSLK